MCTRIYLNIGFYKSTHIYLKHWILQLNIDQNGRIQQGPLHVRLYDLRKLTLVCNRVTSPHTAFFAISHMEKVSKMYFGQWNSRDNER